MIFKKGFIIFIFMFFSILLPNSVNAQEETFLDEPPVIKFYKAKVIDTSKQVEEFQLIKVKITDGDEKDKEVEIKYNDALAFPEKKLNVGETVILTKTSQAAEDVYFISDKYRIPSLIYIFAIFVSLVIFFGKKKGVTSMLGLVFSIFIIAQYIVPQIIDGKNPFLITVTGALMIAVVSIYLSHGFSKRTSIALFSTLITLGLSVILSMFFVSVTKLYGMGSEASIYLQLGPLDKINLQGLLLGGIIIGTLGVLDDITTSLSASIEELKKANISFNFHDLYQRGISIGKEHIASLVNTLVLAYAGVSLPLFLLFTINKSQPLWTTLNSEFFAEEIIRTLVGSSALILAVPITTALASYYFGRCKIN